MTNETLPSCFIRCLLRRFGRMPWNEGTNKDGGLVGTGIVKAYKLATPRESL